MKTLDLNGTWRMRQQSGEVTEGTVPGSVCSFLLESGKMEDPFYRENELQALALFDQDYIFEREFDLTEPVAGREHIALCFEGIDTIAQVRLNGTLLGETDNFYRRWEFDVKELLLPAGNRLQVLIKSPNRYIKEKDAQWHVGGTKHGMVGFPHIRKPHCMFGWDWGPRIPDAGIWKPVSLLAWDGCRLQDIHIRQQHGEQVTVTVNVTAEGCGDVEIELAAPGGEVWKLENGRPFGVERPQLWWPNGLGEQPLYTVTVRLLEHGRVVEAQSRRIGLRTLSIRREKDEWGESFAHEVNGQTFFGMGANYIPEDSIFSRVTPERTRKLLEDCKRANFNVIRAWGGGYYPSDDFYDSCDELGLVVWQDLMFACANYPLDDAFEENITAEIEENVARLRHHASLGLWCGNNEMEWLSAKNDYDGNWQTKAAYIRINEHITPHILKRVDPDTYYWPSSPSSGGSFDDPNSPYRGDVHNWDVWHAGVPFADYRKYCFRYLSEFGFQSFPGIRTVESFTLPEDRNIFSRVMERHQRNEGANGKILQYLSMTYLYPSSFELLLYVSQLLQADAIRYGVEHFRRNRGKCMGAIYWQLNDIWPVASWASIDYYGRWKALHYYAKRFFAPVMISCEEVCELTERSSIIAEPTPNVSTARLAVCNETFDPVCGVVEWELRDPRSGIVASGQKEIDVPAFSAVWLERLDFSDTDILENHLSYRFRAGGRVVSEGTTLFTAPKHYHFADPRLAVTESEGVLTVTAGAYAQGVELYSPDGDVLLEDNFFAMEAGEKRVRILSGDAKTFCVRSVADVK